MTDNDEMMIRRFFADASAKEIADDGFTKRVMKRLPARTNWIYNLWTAVCMVACVAFALAMKLPTLIFVYAKVAITASLITPEKIMATLPIVYVVMMTLIVVAVYKVLKDEPVVRLT